jgi:general secretion pathway protein J
MNVWLAGKRPHQRLPVQSAARAAFSGFTLVELLVAITILVVVAVMSWRGLDVLTRARDSLTNQIEDARRLQLTFAQLQADCANIIDPAMLPGRAPIVITDDSMVLVRHVHAENQPLRLKIVAYHLINGTLARRESVATRDLSILDAAWPLMSSVAAVAQDVPLHFDVASMRIRTWQGAGQGWRTPGIDIVSNDSGKPAVASVFPTGIEVSLRLGQTPGQMTKVFLIGNL